MRLLSNNILDKWSACNFFFSYGEYGILLDSRQNNFFRIVFDEPVANVVFQASKQIAVGKVPEVCWRLANSLIQSEQHKSQGRGSSQKNQRALVALQPGKYDLGIEINNPLEINRIGCVDQRWDERHVLFVENLSSSILSKLLIYITVLLCSGGIFCATIKNTWSRFCEQTCADGECPDCLPRTHLLMLPVVRFFFLLYLLPTGPLSQTSHWPARSRPMCSRFSIPYLNSPHLWEIPYSTAC